MHIPIFSIVLIGFFWGSCLGGLFRENKDNDDGSVTLLCFLLGMMVVGALVNNESSAFASFFNGSKQQRCMSGETQEAIKASNAMAGILYQKRAQG